MDNFSEKWNIFFPAWIEPSADGINIKERSGEGIGEVQWSEINISESTKKIVEVKVGRGM